MFLEFRRASKLRKVHARGSPGDPVHAKPTATAGALTMRFGIGRSPRARRQDERGQKCLRPPPPVPCTPAGLLLVGAILCLGGLVALLADTVAMRRPATSEAGGHMPSPTS
jgi:hypothetical protein